MLQADLPTCDVVISYQTQTDDTYFVISTPIIAAQIQDLGSLMHKLKGVTIICIFWRYNLLPSPAMLKKNLQEEIIL